MKPEYTVTESTLHPGLYCALFMLANLNDLIDGGAHNPDTYREYCRIPSVNFVIEAAADFSTFINAEDFVAANKLICREEMEVFL